MFAQIETTPNPAKLMFLPGCEVLAHGTVDLNAKTQAAASPLAEPEHKKQRFVRLGDPNDAKPQ